MEREYKFLVLDPSPPPTASDWLVPAGLRAVGTYKETHTDTYYDTQDRALLTTGQALRVRVAGAQSRLTWKGGGQRVGALAEREEIEVRWEAGAAPTLESLPRPVRERLPPAATHGVLTRLAELRTERTATELIWPSGTRAELALDRVTVLQPTPHAFVEVELELRGGDLDDLDTLVAVLGGDARLTASALNKLQRALQATATRQP